MGPDLKAVDTEEGKWGGVGPDKGGVLVLCYKRFGVLQFFYITAAFIGCSQDLTFILLHAVQC